jgi:hypothetical protein
MLILGLVLIGAGALLIVAALFTAEATGTGAAVEILGAEVGAVTLFLLGLGAGVAVLWGLSITRFGVKRSIMQRREHNRLNELSEKLDKADAERRRDRDDDEGSPRI